MKHVAYLSIGSNLGDSRAMLAEAITRLKSSEKIAVEKVSTVYRTCPVGVLNQPDFLNGTVKIRTSLAPEALLARCKAIEAEMGRNFEGIKWGPRLIDIDIVFYDDLTLDVPELTIPHPRFQERLFVLVPLLEIEPDLKAPDGEALVEILEKGKNTVFAEQDIEKLSGKPR